VPGVTCSECGKGTNVPLRRGTRLADIECPECGAKALHLRSAGQPNRTAGSSTSGAPGVARRALHHAHPGFTWIPRHGTLDAGAVPGRVAGVLVLRASARSTRWKPGSGSMTSGTGLTITPGPCWRLRPNGSRPPAPVCISVGWRDGRFHTQACAAGTGPTRPANGALAVADNWPRRSAPSRPPRSCRIRSPRPGGLGGAGVRCEQRGDLLSGARRWASQASGVILDGLIPSGYGPRVR
jgi:hypothetical protein